MSANTKTEDKPSISNNKEISKKFELVSTGPEHKGGGIRTSLHGTLYQINLLMLFMKRGLQHKYTFSLATEVDAAHKFDDLVFRYEKDGSGTYRFLQAKHKQDISRKVTEDELMNDTGGDFSVLKYFISYRSIKNATRNLFKGEYQDFIVCTNIDIDNHIAGDFDELTDIDPLIGFSKNQCASQPKRLKLTKGSTLYEQLVEKALTTNFDHYVIVQKIGAMVAKSNIITIENIFKDNRNFIMERIFDKSSKCIGKNNKPYFKFREDFLNPSENDMKIYKAIFINAHIDENPEYLSEIEISTTHSQEEIIKIKRTKATEKLIADTFQIAQSFVNSTAKDKNNTVARNEIEFFLDKFVLAVNQPTEDELKNIAIDEIGDYVNLVDSELAASKLQSCILDWAKQRHGRFVTNEDCQKLFTDFENQLACYMQTGFALTNKHNIDKHGCSFKDDHEILGKIKGVLSRENNVQVILLYTNCQLLTEIKLIQLKRNSKADEFMYSQMKVLVDQVDTKVCPVKAFASRACDQLFISLAHHAELDEKAQEMLKSLLKIVENRPEKQIILILPLKLRDEFENIADDLLQNYKYIQLKDINSKFVDLTQESQDKLLKEAKVKFQGCEVPLCELIDEELKSCLVNDVMSQLICHELKINLEEVEAQYDNKEEYYIDRYLYRCVIIFNCILEKENFCVTHNSQRLNVRDDQEIIIISNNKNEYEELCMNHRNPIHWLKEKDNKLVWEQTKGSITSLRKYISSTRNFDLNEEFRKDVSIKVNNVTSLKDRIVIISAEPGMGKSRLLSQVAVQSRKDINSKAVIKVSLRDYVDEFDDLAKSKITIEEAIAILYQFAKVNSDKNIYKKIKREIVIQHNGELVFRTARDCENNLCLLKTKVFAYLYNNYKFDLLLDGFDEIVPHYKNQVLNLLQVLAETKVCTIWVTTQPYNIDNELEDKLNTFSYRLEPFSSPQQFSYLYRFWEKILDIAIDSDALRAFLSTDRLSQNLNLMHRSVFMGNPQHLFMIATIYKDDFQRYLTNRNDSDEIKLANMTLYDLYSKFYRIKFLKKYEEINMKDPRYKDEYEKKFSDTLYQHGQLALMELFPNEELLEEFVPEEKRRQLEESLMSGDEKTKLVVRVLDGKPQFVHGTFADYFAAEFLANILISEKERCQHMYNAAKDMLYRFLTGSVKPSLLFTFFNYKIASISEHATIFNDAIDLNINKLLSFNENCNYYDCLGRTPIHIICCNSSLHCLHFISLIKGLGSDIIKVQDDLFKWTAFHYSIAAFKCDRVELSCSSGDYDYAEFMPKLKDFETLSLEAAKYELKDDYGMTPGILAARRVSNEACFLARLVLSCSVDAQDLSGKTALHYALARLDSHGMLIAVTLILNGANFTLPDNTGETPLNIILCKKSFEDLKTLIEILIESNNNSLLPVLLEAVSSCRDLCVYLLAHSEPAIKVLIENSNIDINMRDSKGKTALHYAFSEGQQNVALLIKNGANIYLRDEEGNLPSHYNYNSVMQSFDTEGSEIFRILDEITGKHYDTMKHFIATMKFDNNIVVHVLSMYTHISDHLLCNGISVDVKDYQGKTALHHAVIKKRYVNIAYLLRKKANPVMQDKNAKTPLEYLTFDFSNDNVETCVKLNAISRYLLKYGAYFDVPVSDSVKSNCDYLKTTNRLFNAIEMNNIEEVGNILSSNTGVEPQVIVNARRQDNEGFQGMSLLHYAANKGYRDIAKTLLSYGAIYNAHDKNNRLPKDLTTDQKILKYFDLIEKFFDAVRQGSVSEVLGTIEQGVTVNAGCMDGQNVLYPLHIAIRNKNVPLVKLLLNSGAKMSVTLEDATPLHIACQTDEQTMEVLIDCCKLSDLREMFVTADMYQQFPLTVAIQYNDFDIVKVLLEKCELFKSEGTSQEILQILLIYSTCRSVVIKNVRIGELVNLRYLFCSWAWSKMEPLLASNVKF